jgi:hypothetical protein
MKKFHGSKSEIMIGCNLSSLRKVRKRGNCLDEEDEKLQLKNFMRMRRKVRERKENLM